MTGGIRVITVSPEDDGQRLDRWLKKVAPDLPYTLLQKLIRKGQVRIDGKRAKMDMRIASGQEIRIPPSTGMAREDRYFRPQSDDARLVKEMILYDDGDLVAINKPFGIASQGGFRIERHVDGLMDHMADDLGGKPKLCHRLDRDTSGILLLARSRDMAMKVGKAFEGKGIRKYYLAIVAPVPESNQGSIIAPLAKGSGPDKDMMVVDEYDGKFARSEYCVLERAGRRAACVALWPRTGRTHQLRVHCKIAGFPIVGDEKYGDAEISETLIDSLGLSRRLHLHAARLIMPHPGRRGEVLDISAPLPPDLRESWAALGFGDTIDGDPFGHVRL